MPFLTHSLVIHLSFFSQAAVAIPVVCDIFTAVSAGLQPCVVAVPLGKLHGVVLTFRVRSTLCRCVSVCMYLFLLFVCISCVATVPLG
jgi:hypothetical protein